MIKKQGVTIAVMVVTIIILIILAGTITFSSYSTINYTKLSSWANEITYIQDIVDEEMRESSAMDFTTGNITMGLQYLNDVEEQFKDEIIENNQLSLKILDLGKLNVTNTKYGNLENPKDVYAISEKTGRVYYIQGIETESRIYYTLTDSLKNRFNLNTSSATLTSVVFVPSVIGYSNQPITLTVKVPNTYTNINITTSNDEIQIGSQIVKESVYEYAVNTNSIAGNYTVTVSYNDGTQTLTSQYQVNGYDITPPVINPIVHENFVYRESEERTVEYLTNIIATDESKIKVMKYAIGIVEYENAKEYFKENTNVISNGRINLDKTTNKYTIYAEDNAGNFSILSFDKLDYVLNGGRIPETWKENVTQIIDNVPIPKGFVPSPYDGERTKDGGLVIYQLTEAEQELALKELPDENHHTSLTTRNQYVWVPVSSGQFEAQFIRQNMGLTSTISSDVGTNIWEVKLNKETNMPLAEQSSDYFTDRTISEVQAMYASVKKYGGFYIARYEAGIDKQRKADNGVLEKNIYSMMGKIPYNYISWTKNDSMKEDVNGAVQVAREQYKQDMSGFGVVSTLVYGVQWDTTVQWLVSQGAITRVDNSSSYGNYQTHVITSATELNEGASGVAADSSSAGEFVEKTQLPYPKNSGTTWLLSTGALKAAKTNNIYDMAGNIYEWTMEGAVNIARVYRGGGYTIMSGKESIAYRGTGLPKINYVINGFRISLYIK